VVGSSEHGNEPLGSIKSGESLDKMNDYHVVWCSFLEMQIYNAVPNLVDEECIELRVTKGERCD